MFEDSFFLIGGVLLLAFLTAFMGYQHAVIKMDNRILKQSKREIAGLVDQLLFFLPRSAEIAKIKKMRNNPEYEEIIMEYFNYIIGVYNICGIYCRELGFTEAEIKEKFGNYIAILAADEMLLNEINREPGFYRGAEYLLEVCR